MPAPSVHLKIKIAAINGNTRYITTISRKNRGREQSMKRNSVPMVDTVELGTFYLLFILFLQQSQDSDSKHNPVTCKRFDQWTDELL